MTDATTSADNRIPPAAATDAPPAEAPPPAAVLAELPPEGLSVTDAAERIAQLLARQNAPAAVTEQPRDDRGRFTAAPPVAQSANPGSTAAPPPAAVANQRPAPRAGAGGQGLAAELVRVDAQLLAGFTDLMPQPGESPLQLAQRQVQVARENPGRWTEYQALLSARGTLAGHLQGAQLHAYHASRQQAMAQLAQLVPEWQEPAAMRQGVEEVRQWLKGIGVRGDVADGIIDPYEISIARDAMRYRQLAAEQAQARSLVEKRVAGVPPVQRPGARGELDTGADRVGALRARAAATGSVNDAAAAIRAMLGR